MKKGLTLVLFWVVFGAEAQNKFFERLSVVQTFQSQLAKEEAAYVNLVYPKDDTSSINHSFAIGYNILSKDLKYTRLRPFFEWQKNTLLKDKQDVIFSGLDFQTFFWDVLDPSDKHAHRIWTPYLLAKVNYKKDNVKKTEGTQGSLYFSPEFNRNVCRFLLMPGVMVQNDSSTVRFYYDVYAGVEYEDRNTSDIPSNGDVWRFAYRLTANLTLFEKFEIVPDYINRRLLYRTTDSEKGKSEFFKISFNLKLAEKKNNNIGDLKVGLDFVKGVDPTKGFDNQQVTTLTFKFKI